MQFSHLAAYLMNASEIQHGRCMHMEDALAVENLSKIGQILLVFDENKLGKISAQPHPTLCIPFLNRENNDKNNTFLLGKQICFTIVWGCAETLPISFFRFGSFPCQFRTRGNVGVDKDLTQHRVLFLHMVKMLGLGIEFRVYSFNPMFTIESKAHVPLSKKMANMFFQHIIISRHVWEFFPKELKKICDVFLCNKKTRRGGLKT